MSGVVRGRESKEIRRLTYYVTHSRIRRIPPLTPIRRARPVRNLGVDQLADDIREHLLVDDPRRERVAALLHVPLHDLLVWSSAE